MSDTVVSGDYSLTYHTNENRIVISLPPTMANNTVSPISRRRADLSDNNALWILQIVKSAFGDGGI